LTYAQRTEVQQKCGKGKLDGGLNTNAFGFNDVNCCVDECVTKSRSKVWDTRKSGQQTSIYERKTVIHDCVSFCLCDANEENNILYKDYNDFSKKESKNIKNVIYKRIWKHDEKVCEGFAKSDANRITFGGPEGKSETIEIKTLKDVINTERVCRFLEKIAILFDKRSGSNFKLLLSQDPYCKKQEEFVKNSVEKKESC